MGKVYIIKNNNNNKVYVGMTKNCIIQRFAQHIDNAFRTSDNRRNSFYKDIVNSGDNILKDFSIRVLEECSDEILRDRESEYIGRIRPQYNEQQKRSYIETQKDDIVSLYLSGKNITEIRELYRCRHDLIRNILNQANIPIKRSRAAQCKKVYLFNAQGLVVREWINSSECADELGVDRGNIRLCCIKNTKENMLYFSAGGYNFKYNKETPKDMYEVIGKEPGDVFKFKTKKSLLEFFEKNNPGKKISYGQLVRKRKTVYGFIVNKLYPYRN